MPPSEKSVRKQEIDRALQAAGWSVVSYARWSKGDRTAADAKRVDRAIAKTFGAQTLSSQQSKWLELIRRHLIANLAIERDDFELLTFEQQGATWQRVNMDFGGRLAEMLLNLNGSIAA